MSVRARQVDAPRRLVARPDDRPPVAGRQRGHTDRGQPPRHERSCRPQAPPRRWTGRGRGRGPRWTAASSPAGGAEITVSASRATEMGAPPRRCRSWRPPRRCLEVTTSSRGGGERRGGLVGRAEGGRGGVVLGGRDVHEKKRPTCSAEINENNTYTMCRQKQNAKLRNA